MSMCELHLWCISCGRPLVACRTQAGSDSVTPVGRTASTTAATTRPRGRARPLCGDTSTNGVCHPAAAAPRFTPASGPTRPVCGRAVWFDVYDFCCRDVGNNMIEHSLSSHVDPSTSRSCCVRLFAGFRRHAVSCCVLLFRNNVMEAYTLQTLNDEHSCDRCHICSPCAWAFTAVARSLLEPPIFRLIVDM